MAAASSPIPVINISNPTVDIAEQLVDAAGTHGFVFIEFESTNLQYKDVERMFEIVWCHFFLYDLKWEI